MTNPKARPYLRLALLGGALSALSACGGGFDGDLRSYGDGVFSTSDAALQATGQRPAPDSRGIISYPGYQVVIARRGDTVDSIAARVGIPAAELGNYNAIGPGTALRQDEVLALPRRVGEALPGPAGVAGPVPTTPGGGIDVSTLASGAISRAEATQPAASGAPATAQPAAAATSPSGAEPVRHKVERGETAYSIARLYNVNVRALADWNGLGSDLAVREGQILLIPVATGAPQPTDAVSLPGEGSSTPVPPSASTPLPAEKPVAVTAPVKTPPAPDLGTTATAKFSMPVQGKIIRGYQKKKNDGIDIAAAAGSAVAAAGDGLVAAITKNTAGMPILVIRHGDPKDKNALLSVYANVDNIAVAKGARVKRGQTIASIRASDPAFLHFEIRQGFESVDPMPYLQ